MHNIEDYKNDTLLRFDVWAGSSTKKGWVVREIAFSTAQLEEVNRFKAITEKFNKFLSYVNRAIGHRVWNQIQFYIANYPTICQLVDCDEDLTQELKDEMHIAFEDQIVQNLMPKLHGVEVTDHSYKNCFKKIIALFESENFNFTTDIENACNAGFGTFIWCSNEYIKEV